MQLPKNPVVGVTWSEAGAFCSWLTARERAEGLITARSFYRLLSSREWNQAAGLYPGNQAGSTPLTSHGPLFRYAGNLPPAWQFPGATPAPGTGWSKPPIPPAGTFRSLYGINDLGNGVREWCRDAAPGNDPAQAIHLIRDRPGPAARGPGAFSAPGLTLEAVDLAAAGSRQDGLGFRIVLELPPVHALAE